MSRGISLRDVKVIYKKFDGRADRFHKDGQQPNFSIVINEEDIGYLRDDLKLNVKTKVNSDGDTFSYLKVTVGKYGNIYCKTAADGIRKLDPSEYAALDNMIFNRVDIQIIPHEYTTPMGSGFSAYLGEMFIEERQHSDLYSDWMNPDNEVPF